MNRTIAKNCRNLNKNLKESLFEIFLNFFLLWGGYAVIKSDKKALLGFLLFGLIMTNHKSPINNQIP